MRNILKYLLLGFIGISSLSTCSKELTQTEELNPNQEQEKLILGFMPSLDSVPFIIAQQQGFDKKYNVEFIIQTFKSPTDRDAAFQANEIDGMNTDLLAVILAFEAGIPLKITNSTFGQFDLISNESDIQALKSKEILVAKNAGSEFAATKILEHANIAPSLVKLTNLAAVPARVALIENKKSSAAILPEPLSTIALAHGMKKLGSTRDIGLNPFVLAFNQTTIEKKEKSIHAMFQAYNDAVDFMQSHEQSQYIKLYIQTVGFPEEMLEIIEIPQYTKIEQVKSSDIEAVLTWCIEKEMISKKIHADDIVSNIFFNISYQNDQLKLP